MAAFLADRDHQPSADRKLLLQGARHFGAACRDQNRVERSRVGPALGAVADPDLDVAVTERVKAISRGLAERVMPLDRIDLLRDLTDDSGRVARAGPDLQHPVTWTNLSRLDHCRDDIGLRDRLTFFDRQRRILIGELGHRRVDKTLARNFAHRRQDVSIGDPASRDLGIHHLTAQTSIITHPALRSRQENTSEKQPFLKAFVLPACFGKSLGGALAAQA